MSTAHEGKDIAYDTVGFRGISKKTAQFYGVQTKFADEEPVERAFPFGKALKIKNIQNKKDMRCVGPFKDAKLFGMDLFDRGSRKSVTITEGEEDAMAAYEMLRGNSACVSLKSGAGSAFRDLSSPDIYDYLNTFDRIYICFDNDEPGQTAVRSLQGLFDFKKVYHVRMTKFKDANDYLEAGEADEFERMWKSAKRFVPDNIISSFSDIERALDESKDDMLGTYVSEALNDKLYGIFAGDVIVVKAMEGVGKTEFFRASEYHLLKNTEYPIGIIHLEEDNATTIKAIAGYELGVPAVLPDCGLSRQDILDGYKRAVRDDEGRIHIHSSFDIEDEGSFLGNIRFLVSAAGCRFIFLDHISWLATGGDDEDERKKLDRISQKLKLLAKELKFALIMISHVNDNGQTRGSRNISKVANVVISLHRDLNAGSNATEYLVEKARLGGGTGPAGQMFYHRRTGRLEPFPEIIEPKPGGEEGSGLPYDPSSF